MDSYNDRKNCDYFTDSHGRPIPNENNSLTIGCDGPTLIQDTTLIDKLAHFNRERIPERVVHAKGAGAFGFFQNYRCMADYTIADFLQCPGQRTKVFVRFSTVIGSKGSADTARDPRGFAVKFYTKQGNYDIVGNNLPVFFVRDAIRFPDVIHALKPDPCTNIRDPKRFWDFVSLMPEATHMITWVYSDRGTIKDYRCMDGFGVNTFVWVNRCGKRVYVKYHFKSKQGIQTIDRFEAEELAGSNPDIATHALHHAIECRNYPRWELCVQIMDPDKVDCLEFDPLDDTKIWPEDDFPLIPIGMLCLNQNPSNFFAQVEQSAFCPGNIIPGVELSADKMLQGRAFAYSDAHRHRLGGNFTQLPINRPLCPPNNNERDGASTYDINTEPINYSPNSLNYNQPLPAPIPIAPYECIGGFIAKVPIGTTNDFSQAGKRYRCLSDCDQDHLIDNIASELYLCKNDIVDRVISYFCKADEEFGNRVCKAVESYRCKNCES
ncbi:catalase [Lachnospiraceae bacterium KM106-2]|nr:catalase [Lachnospiraceae bacterium KM106-2]